MEAATCDLAVRNCQETARASGESKQQGQAHHEEVFVSESLSSWGRPCQHLQEPSHDPGGVAFPRMHPPCHNKYSQHGRAALKHSRPIHAGLYKLCCCNNT